MMALMAGLLLVGALLGACAAVQAPSAERYVAERPCCRVCTTGCACGDSCISCKLTCRRPPGCACNG